MNQPHIISQSPAASRFSPEEWQIRCELAAAYRLAHNKGWTSLIFNHITARVPGPEEHFLINHFGLRYDEITASNLLKVDLDGNIIDGDGTEQVNLAGYVIHSAIHGAREDVVCALHTHGPASVAVSCLEEGFMFINQDSMQFSGKIAYHDFEGIAINEGERDRLVADLGTKSTLILRNHGALTVGRSVGEAFVMMWLLEHACKIQLSVMATGAKINALENGQLDAIAAQVPEQQKAITPDGLGKLPFDALLREVAVTDPDYCS